MPGGNFESDNDDFDSQDQSETLDESNTIGDGDRGEVRTFADGDDRNTFEELPDVEDVTRAAGDALGADAFDPEAMGDELLDPNNLSDLGYDER